MPGPMPCEPVGFLEAKDPPPSRPGALPVRDGAPWCRKGVPMTKVEALIRPQKVGSVIDALSRIGFHGMIVTEVSIVGKHEGVVEQYRGVLRRSRLNAKM